MNAIRVQTKVERPYHSGAAVYLKTDSGKYLKLAFDINGYTRVHGNFDIDTAEFAYFCAVIYGCDQAIKRDMPNGDRWTREIMVEIPVSDPDKWNECKAEAERMVGFLTGDIWYLTFVPHLTPLFGETFENTRKKFRKRRRICGKSVSLFSGGLDSLVGIIDWLEQNPKSSLVLASTYDAHAESAKKDQERVLPHLKDAYPNRLIRFVARSGLCEKGGDINFRSRSLTFLGNAVLAASFLGSETEIQMPENGAIALNFPLTPARQGSFSTRTAHPHFISQFNSVLKALNFSFRASNPYELKTKGEVLQGCLNQTLIKKVYQESVSCGKRGFSKIHWHDKTARACGHCIPCVFRQAAVLSAGFKSEIFGCNIQNQSEWGDSNLLKPNGDLYSIIDFVNSNHTDRDIWRILRANGRLDWKSKSPYIELIIRLKSELKIWLTRMGLI